MEETYKIFNRPRLRQHRNRAAPNFSQHDFLLQEIASRLGERVIDMRKRFPLGLDLGAHHGIMAAHLSTVGTLVQADLSESFITQVSGIKCVMDEELLPFAANSFDLIVSAASLHWVNDLPGALVQIQRCLKPGGLFVAILPGGETLKELRQSFEQAEIMFRGGLSPRISPFIDVQSAASLLQRAGFSEPVCDSEVITIQYDHPLKLLKDLRGMGESNALLAMEKKFLPCGLMMMAMDHYLREFSNEDGRINATFELVTLTGWKS